MDRAQVLRAAALCFLLGGCGFGADNLELGQERLSEREADNTAAMIDAIKAISLRRYPSGTVRRFNQPKTLACYNASFAVPQDLGEELQQGIFIPGANYRAQIRFANASQTDDRKKDFRGMSIKLSGVAGESLWGTAGQQDFLLNSYPALFAANPADFLDFINASADDKLWRYFINPLHFYSLNIAPSVVSIELEEPSTRKSASFANGKIVVGEVTRRIKVPHWGRSTTSSKQTVREWLDKDRDELDTIYKNTEARITHVSTRF